MTAWSDYWQDSATFRRKDNAWSCIGAGPYLQFIVGMPIDRIKLDLIRRGIWFSFSNRPQDGPFPPKPAAPDNGAPHEAQSPASTLPASSRADSRLLLDPLWSDPARASSVGK